MTVQHEATTTTREDIVARNLAAVEQHFHNENAESIDLAVAVYTDDIVWEVPARGLILRDREEVKREYLRIFDSMVIHKITGLRRFATEDWVFDDSIFEFTITGNGFRNCPFPPGSHVSVRLTHCFEMRAGEVCREIGYEIWRLADNDNLVNDSIPDSATTDTFD